MRPITYPCPSNTMDVVFAVIREVVVLDCLRLAPIIGVQETKCTHDDITDILDICERVQSNPDCLHTYRHMKRNKDSQ